MRKQLIITILVFLLSLSIVSAASNWPQYGFDTFTTSRADPTFYNSLNAANMTDATISAGSGFQILANDIDNDGTIEIITSNGAYVQVYTSSGQTISLEDEVLLHDTQDSVGWSGDVDGDNLEEYIVSFGNVIYTIEYNGTDFNTTLSYNVSAAGYTVVTGIVCDSYGGTYACYAGSTNSQLIEYNPNTGGGALYNLSTPDFTCTHCLRMAPFSYDVDNDGDIELGFVGSETFTLVDQTGPSVDWIYDAGGAGTDVVYGALAYNLDGAGDTEVCISWTDSDGSGNLHEAKLTCLNGDSSVFNTSQVYYETSGPGINYAPQSNPVMANVDGIGDPEICVIGANQNTQLAKQRVLATCYTIGSTLTLLDQYEVNEPLTHFVAYGGAIEIAAAGNVREDGKAAIPYGDSIFYYDGSNMARDNATGQMSNSSQAKSIFDANADSFIEIFESLSASFIGWYSGLTNNPPTLNNSQNYGGYGANYDYTSPICVDTTVTFTAQECGGGADCNYDNDGSGDQERLRTNCGTGDIENGTLSLASPTFDCFMNQTGSYQLTIYIEDDSNPGDTTQFNTQSIILNVIDGTAGVTCGFTGGDPGFAGAPITSAQGQRVDDSLEGSLELLLGSDAEFKTLLGIAILVGLMVSVASILPHILLVTVIGMVGTIGLTLLGFFPFWVVIVLLLSMTLFIIFANFIRGGQGGG